ncbi:MAG: ABC transporter permease [Rhodobacteraceae bacterium]|nr:ABC transporter permease [Paracoccaceae bacterium]
MRVLDKKLFRDFWRLWAQSLAIALVLACGVMILVIAIGVERSLSETQSTFYERNRFADIFASATRAPNDLKREIEQISGVSIVETRIVQYSILDLEGLSEPATARLVSLPPMGEPLLNIPSLTTGRMPDPQSSNEVVVNSTFAIANNFTVGSSFHATLNGQKRLLTISGTVLSPEFIYLIGPGAVMPDNRRFGVVWMGYDALASAFDLGGAFNDVSVRLTRDANEQMVIDELEKLLAPYGGTGPYDRSMQTSHMFLDSELKQLKAMGKAVPPLFFVISAFLVNMVLGRLITLEREQIGLFKAVGYSNAAISWHYVKLAMGIGLFGVLVGWAAGISIAYWMAGYYTVYFQFPYLIYITSPDTYAISAMAGIGAAVLGAAQSVMKTTKLSPAVAMSPPAPTRFKQNIFDKIGHFMGARQPVMMIIRSITRWPMRASLTTIGIALSVATMIATLFMFDSMDIMMDSAFFQANRQQATLSLAQPQSRAVLADVENLPGVLRAEGMQTVAVRLTNRHLTKIIGVEGRDPGMDLSRVLDAGNNSVVFPQQGIVLSDRLANQLDAQIGDTLDMEVLQGQRGHFEVPVTGVIRQYFGIGAYMDLNYLSALLQLQPLVNSVNISIDENALNGLYEQVKAAPNIAGIVRWDQIRQGFNDTVAQSSGITTTIYAFIASLIVVGVVYNSARILLSERARELASLRILGFTQNEVSFILMGELLFLTMVAIPIGFFFGYLMALGIVESFSSDMFTLPFYISRGTYGFAGVVAFTASAASALLVRRRINRLDLVAVMKTRE